MMKDMYDDGDASTKKLIGESSGQRPAGRLLRVFGGVFFLLMFCFFYSSCLSRECGWMDMMV